MVTAIVSDILPEPVLFHPLKHHAGYIRAFINRQVAHTTDNLSEALRSLGSSQLDFYLGNLSPQQLAQEVIANLQQRKLLQPQAYGQFLETCKGHYHLITLSDGSEWVLRWGNLPGRHVHLHPARYAAHTTRVKAASLKTAIAATIASEQQRVTIDLVLVNAVRANWLQLPPLTKLTSTEGAGKLIMLLQPPL